MEVWPLRSLGVKDTVFAPNGVEAVLRFGFLDCGRFGFLGAGLGFEAVGEHVFEAERVFLDIVDDFLGEVRKKRMEGKSRDGDNKSEGGGVQRDGDVFSEFFGFFFGGGAFESLERKDQTKDRPEKSEHGGDVGDSGKVVGAFLDFGEDLKRGFFDGAGDRFGAFVGAGEAGFDHAGECCSGGGVTEFDGAVDVVGHNELLDLSHKGFSVDVVFEEEKHKALDDQAKTHN